MRINLVKTDLKEGLAGCQLLSQQRESIQGMIDRVLSEESEDGDEIDGDDDKFEDLVRSILDEFLRRNTAMNIGNLSISEDRDLAEIIKKIWEGRNDHN